MLRFLSLSLLLVGVFGGSVAARVEGNSSFERALYVGGYDVAVGDGLLCYAKTDTPNTFDLSRLCGFIQVGSQDNGGFGSGYSGGGSRGRSRGVCRYPGDIASDGSRCGGRSSSDKEGGN
jgi:hypothetical protein